MTDAQKEARALAAIEAAEKRSAAIETAQLEQIRNVWLHVDAETRAVFIYIEREIAAGHRSPEDVKFLRETRRRWLRPILKRLNLKEANADES